MSKTDKKKIVRAERGQMKGWKGKNKRWYSGAKSYPKV